MGKTWTQEERKHRKQNDVRYKRKLKKQEEAYEQEGGLQGNTDYRHQRRDVGCGREKNDKTGWSRKTY